MSTTERDLKLRLTIDVPDPSKPSRVFQDIANQAQRAGQAVQDANRHMQRFGHAGAGGGGGYAGGGQSWPMPYGMYGGGGGYAQPMYNPSPIIQPGMGAAAGKPGGMKGLGAALGLAAVTDVLANLGETASKLNDPLRTANEKLTDTIRLVPLFGDTLARLAEGVGGIYARLRDPSGTAARDRYRAEFGMNATIAENNARGVERIGGLTRATAGSRFESDAAARFPRATSVFAGLSGAGGLAGLGYAAAASAAFEDPSADSIALANRGVYAAERTVGAARLDVLARRDSAAAADARLRDATAAREAAGRAAGVGSTSWLDRQGIGPGRTDVYKDAQLKEQKAIEDSLREQNRLMQAQERYGQATADAAKKRFEVSKAETDSLRSRAEILKQEYQQASASARNFGAMDAIEQRGLLDSATRFKRGGANAVTQQELAALQQFAPDAIGKDLQKGASANPFYKQLTEILGIRDAETVGKELQKVQTEISMKVAFDEEQLAKSLKVAMEKTNGDIEKTIVKIVRLENEKARLLNLAGRP